MGDLFLENDLRDWLQAVESLPADKNVDKKLLHKSGDLFARFMELPGLERAVLFNKLNPILWHSRKEILDLRLNLLRFAAVGTPVSEVFSDLLRRHPAEPDLTIQRPYLNAITGAALGELAEMAHRAKIQAAR